MLAETVPIRTVRKRKVQHLRIGHRLLKAMGDTVVIVLGFHDRDGMIPVQVQEIVDLFRFFTICHVPTDIDLAIRDLCLHRDVVAVPPAAGIDSRRDKIELNVFFSHALFIEYHSAHPLSCDNHFFDIIVT